MIKLGIYMTLVNAALAYLIIKQQEKNMASTRDQLDAKITEVGTRLANVIADLQAKIDAGSQPEDFQAEVDKLQAVVDALNTADPDNTNNETPAAPSSTVV
jgi:hypothetical protein